MDANDEQLARLKEIIRHNEEELKQKEQQYEEQISALHAASVFKDDRLSQLDSQIRQLEGQAHELRESVAEQLQVVESRDAAIKLLREQQAAALQAKDEQFAEKLAATQLYFEECLAEKEDEKSRLMDTIKVRKLFRFKASRIL
uniref:Myosin_tail_1 domain-containing protein n=1 Tax=Macrostomum lignano TaxID=282301 RepID=A0A1I8H8W0_9PLAT